MGAAAALVGLVRDVGEEGAATVVGEVGEAAVEVEATDN